MYIFRKGDVSMGILDDVKSTVGNAAKDENVKNTVKSTVSNAVTKAAGDKVDEKCVKDTVNTVVDEAARIQYLYDAAAVFCGGEPVAYIKIRFSKEHVSAVHLQRDDAAGYDIERSPADLAVFL